jgi:hypothetical protein
VISITTDCLNYLISINFLDNYSMNKHAKEIEAAKLRRNAEQLATWAIVHPKQAEPDA